MVESYMSAIKRYVDISECFLMQPVVTRLFWCIL